MNADSSEEKRELLKKSVLSLNTYRPLKEDDLNKLLACSDAPSSIPPLQSGVGVVAEVKNNSSVVNAQVQTGNLDQVADSAEK